MCELFKTVRRLYAYFWNFKEQIILNNLGLSGMIRSLSNMPERSQYVYWNPDELRKDRENSVHQVTKEESTTLGTFMAQTAAIQVLLGLALVGVFRCRSTGPRSVRGIGMLAAGGDFMLIRKLSMQKNWK
jgi:hypothetical protein